MWQSGQALTRTEYYHFIIDHLNYDYIIRNNNCEMKFAKSTFNFF